MKNLFIFCYEIKEVNFFKTVCLIDVVYLTLQNIANWARATQQIDFIAFFLFPYLLLSFCLASLFHTISTNKYKCLLQKCYSILRFFSSVLFIMFAVVFASIGFIVKDQYLEQTSITYIYMVLPFIILDLYYSITLTYMCFGK